MQWLQNSWAWFRSQSDKFQRTILCLLIGFVCGIIVACPRSKEVAEAGPDGYSFGAIYDPQLTDEIVASFPAQSRFFGDAGKNLVEQAERKTVILTDLYREFLGKDWPAHDQDGEGCCVGEGWAAALGLESLVQKKLGKPVEYKPISSAAIYALAREEGKMLGPGDGAVPAYAAKALMEVGCISCEQAGDDNTTGKPHAAIADKWGRTGLPADLKKLCGDRKLGVASKVRTPEEVEAAIRNGYPVPIASNIGFEGKGGFKRDSNGFCYAGKTWPHQMVCAGFVLDAGGPGVHGFLILQSWGERMPPGPKPDWMPNCGFLITWRDMQRVVEQGSSFAISGFNAFPAQNVPGFIMRRSERHYALRPTFNLAF